MADFPTDIYTEPSEIDPDTLKNLGPLALLAGVWEGKRGLDVNPKADGPEKDASRLRRRDHSNPCEPFTRAG